MSVPARARYQMQAAGAVPAHRAELFSSFGKHAAVFAQIAGPNQPDSAEIRVEEPDDGIGDFLEFLVQRRRSQERSVGAG